jgi:hypothetical protein
MVIDDICFVLDLQADLDFFSGSSMKQQSTGKMCHSTLHIILTLSQPVCSYCLMLYPNSEPASLSLLLYAMFTVEKQ